MKNKKLAVILLAIFLLMVSVAMFSGCVEEEPKPKEVLLELVNPITGDAIKNGDIVDLPESGTPIEVRIREKETMDGVIGSCDVYWRYIIEDKVQDPQETFRYWPTHEQLKEWSWRTINYLAVDLRFDCNKGIRDPNYERKYPITSTQIRFYINEKK